MWSALGLERYTLINYIGDVILSLLANLYGLFRNNIIFISTLAKISVLLNMNDYRIIYCIGTL